MGMACLYIPVLLKTLNCMHFPKNNITIIFCRHMHNCTVGEVYPWSIKPEAWLMARRAGGTTDHSETTKSIGIFHRDENTK